MPVWKMFGVTSWIAAGRTAYDYNELSFNGGFTFRMAEDLESGWTPKTILTCVWILDSARMV